MVVEGLAALAAAREARLEGAAVGAGVGVVCDVVVFLLPSYEVDGWPGMFLFLPKGLGLGCVDVLIVKLLRVVRIAGLDEGFKRVRSVKCRSVAKDPVEQPEVVEIVEWLGRAVKNVREGVA